MTDAPAIDGDDARAAERLAESGDVHATAWQRTLDDMWALEADLQDEGWGTLATAAGHTAPLAPSQGSEYWGLVHVVPDSDADAIDDATERGEFPNYDVYRSTVDGRVFGVTVLADAETSTAVLVANQFELREAHALVEHSHETGLVDTVFRHLDGTVAAAVRHDDPGKFFPRYEEFGER